MGRYVAIAELALYAPAGRVLELADAPFDATLEAPGAAAAVIETAIASAEDEIDGVLGRRIAVPLGQPSAEIRRMAAQNALFHLAARKSEFVEVWARQRDGNLKRLDAIASAEQEATGATVVEAALLTTEGEGLLINGGLSDF